MARRVGPKKVQQYILEFKLKTVRLSQLQGVEVQAVAAALEIHPFMLSRWRKEARDGVLRGRVSVPKVVKTPPAREMKRFQALQRAHAVLQEEHALLKKHIRFTSARKPTSSRSSKKNGSASAWRGRPASTRRRQDRVLLAEIRAIFAQSGGTYGSPRIQRALRGRGYWVSGRRIARLMRQAGLRARLVRVYRPKAGTHRWFNRQANHVRGTQATRLDQIWVGDVTYLAVGARWWYLVVVLDQCSRRVLAWRLAATRDSRTTRAVLDAALRRRQPSADLIFHSDRGSEFQGTPVRRRLAAKGIRQSMTRGGAPGENAHMESFFHSVKAEVIHGRTFLTVGALRQQLRCYIRYYNHQRLHSAIGYRSPVDYERRAA